MNQPDPAELERCPRLVIRISELPEPAREEVESALEEGHYESDEELYLSHVLNPAETYLQGEDEQFYRAMVEEANGTRTLELKTTEPSRGDYPITLVNERNEELAVEIRIEHVDASDRVIDERTSIAPDTVTETKSFERVFGQYRAVVDTEELSETIEWRERELQAPMRRFIIADEITYEPRPVADPIDCRRDVWE